MLGKKRVAAAISPFLIGFPLLVLVATVTLNGGSLTGASANYSVCNPNSNNCSASSSQGTTYSCAQALGFPCNISSGCKVPPYPPPAYCAGGLLDQQTLIPAGTSIFIPSALQQAAQSSSGVFFGLGTIGNGGFIAIIGLFVGIVSLAGITIFGSGTGSESVHILFMGGLFMGLWIFLSGLEGFLAGSPTSFFTELNALVPSSALGTAFYVALTFVYLLGFASMVKRGSA